MKSPFFPREFTPSHPRRRTEPARALHAGLILAATFALTGCDFLSPPPPEKPKPQVVIDKLFSLGDGNALSWAIQPGLYRVEMTASGDGASVEWIGANCQGAKEQRVFDGVCEMGRTGQLQVSNPTTFGLGNPTTVTLKVTRLPG